jgi:hypothetical protein
MKYNFDIGNIPNNFLRTPAARWHDPSGPKIYALSRPEQRPNPPCGQSTMAAHVALLMAYAGKRAMVVAQDTQLSWLYRQPDPMRSFRHINACYKQFHDAALDYVEAADELEKLPVQNAMSQIRIDMEAVSDLIYLPDVSGSLRLMVLPTMEAPCTDQSKKTINAARRSREAYADRFFIDNLRERTRNTLDYILFDLPKDLPGRDDAVCKRSDHVIFSIVPGTDGLRDAFMRTWSFEQNGRYDIRTQPVYLHVLPGWSTQFLQEMADSLELSQLSIGATERFLNIPAVRHNEAYSAANYLALGDPGVLAPLIDDYVNVARQAFGADTVRRPILNAAQRTEFLIKPETPSPRLG